MLGFEMESKFGRFGDEVLDSAWLLGGVVVTGIVVVSLVAFILATIAVYSPVFFTVIISTVVFIVVGTTLVKLNKIWKEL